MVGRLFAVGVAWLAAIGLFAALLQVAGRPDRRGPGWRVLQTEAAHHTMVMEVEADRMDEARQIAREILGPLQPKGYEEVLIYFHPAGRRPENAPVRRIQWTPRGGLVETSF